MVSNLKEESKFVSFMSRHFVALTIDYESLNPDGSVMHRGTTARSGFIIELSDQWFWVTAGHCLNSELDHRIEKGEIRVLSTGLMDCFGLDSGHLPPVPFEYVPGSSLNVEDKALGLDFALLDLDANKRKLLEANNVVPIRPKNVAGGTMLLLY